MLVWFQGDALVIFPLRMFVNAVASVGNSPNQTELRPNIPNILV